MAVYPSPFAPDPRQPQSWYEQILFGGPPVGPQAIMTGPAMAGRGFLELLKRGLKGGAKGLAKRARVPQPFSAMSGAEQAILGKAGLPVPAGITGRIPLPMPTGPIPAARQAVAGAAGRVAKAPWLTETPTLGRVIPPGSMGMRRPPVNYMPTGREAAAIGGAGAGAYGLSQLLGTPDETELPYEGMQPGPSMDMVQQQALDQLTPIPTDISEVMRGGLVPIPTDIPEGRIELATAQPAGTNPILARMQQEALLRGTQQEALMSALQQQAVQQATPAIESGWTPQRETASAADLAARPSPMWPAPSPQAAPPAQQAVPTPAEYRPAPYPMYPESRGWDTAPDWMERAIAENRGEVVPEGVPQAAPQAAPASIPPQQAPTPWQQFQEATRQNRPGYGPQVSDEELGLQPPPPGAAGYGQRREAYEVAAGQPRGGRAPWQPFLEIPPITPEGPTEQDVARQEIFRMKPPATMTLSELADTAGMSREQRFAEMLRGAQALTPEQLAGRHGLGGVTLPEPLSFAQWTAAQKEGLDVGPWKGHAYSRGERLVPLTKTDPERRAKAIAARELVEATRKVRLTAKRQGRAILPWEAKIEAKEELDRELSEADVARRAAAAEAALPEEIQIAKIQTEGQKAALQATETARQRQEQNQLLANLAMTELTQIAGVEGNPQRIREIRERVAAERARILGTTPIEPTLGPIEADFADALGDIEDRYKGCDTPRYKRNAIAEARAKGVSREIAQAWADRVFPETTKQELAKTAPSTKKRPPSGPPQRFPSPSGKPRKTWSDIWKSTEQFLTPADKNWPPVSLSPF